LFLINLKYFDGSGFARLINFYMNGGTFFFMTIGLAKVKIGYLFDNIEFLTCNDPRRKSW